MKLISKSESQQRPPIFWLLISLPLWVLGIMLAYAMIIAQSPLQPGTDLYVYKKAADFIAIGANPYDSATFNMGELRWQYPPFALLVVAPLHFVPVDMAFMAWTVIAVMVPVLLMIAVVTRRILGPIEKTFKSVLLRVLTILALVVIAASSSTILDTYQLGQIGALLAVLVVYDLIAPDSWRRVGRFHIPKGVGVGLATAIKLTPAIFIVHLMVTRQWRTAINAILTTVTSWTLAFIIFPAYSTYFWFQGGLFRAATENEPARVIFNDNISIGAAFDRIRVDLGADIETMSAVPRLALIVIVAILGLLAAGYLHRANRGILAVFVVGLTATLVSPISWLHAGTFMALLAPTLFLIAMRARREGKYSAGPLYVMGVAFFTVVALPSQVIGHRFIQPEPINGLYFTVAMILSIVALTALGRQKDTEVSSLN